MNLHDLSRQSRCRNSKSIRGQGGIALLNMQHHQNGTKAKHVAQILKGMQDTMSKCHPQTAPGLQAEPSLCGIYALSMRLKCGQNATCLALFDGYNMDLSRDHKHTTNTRKIIKMRQKAKHVAQILKTGARYHDHMPAINRPRSANQTWSMRDLCGFYAVSMRF